MAEIKEWMVPPGQGRRTNYLLGFCSPRNENLGRVSTHEDDKLGRKSCRCDRGLQGHWSGDRKIPGVATSVTGFFYFPFDGFTPAQAFGILSMILLTLAVYGRYGRGLIGPWSTTFVITSVASFYLNFFVLIVQAFQKIPVLHAAAPTQASPVFALAQGTALVLFIIAGVVAVKRFR
jgi:hypothetical protein